MKEWQHERCRKVYESGIREELERGLGRKEAVQLARLRSGHSLELLGYRARVGLLEGEGLCRKCGEEGEGLEHVWGCPGGDRQRRVLGLTDLGDLCRMPREALIYWRWWQGGRPPEA